MKKLHPRAVWLFFIPSLFGWFLGFLVLGYFLFRFLNEFSDDFEVISTIGWLLVSIFILITFFSIILLYIWAKLSHRSYKYELTEDGFKKELGVISKRYVTIPYDRIQNVDIYRGILTRILGLSDLSIQTAGSPAHTSGAFAGNAEGRLPGLLEKDAEELRDELIRRAKQSKTKGL